MVPTPVRPYMVPQSEARIHDAGVLRIQQLVPSLESLSAVTTPGGASVCRRANEVCGDVPLSCRRWLAASMPVRSSQAQALRLAVSPDAGEAAFQLHPGTISA
jgi:hypothetical protein